MKITQKKLKNGSNLILVPNKESLAVTLLVLVSTGSKYETRDKNGISHFLEHMCFKGTLKRPRAIDISKELDSIGSQYNAFTSQEFTGYYAKSHPDHLNTLIDVISDIYLNSVFDQKEIEKEKGVIVEEINMYEDMPHRQVQDIFTSVLYGDTPAGWTILGPKENILKMKDEDIISYRKKHYIPSKTKIILAGNFDVKKADKNISQIFEKVKKQKIENKEKVVERQTEPNILIKPKKTDQTHIVLGFRTFKANDKRSPVLKVLDVILGGGMSSRLFQKLREEMGVGYYVRTSVDEFTDHGNFSVSIGCDNKRVKEVISVILEEFKKLKTELVSEEELSKAKEYFVGNTFLSLESSDSVAEYVGIQAVLNNKIETPNEMIKKIKRVKAKDILKLAKEIFVNKGLNVAMVGDLYKEKDLKDLLKI